jgi:EAL domain-containing protein (putative c-di-GMP-specific phosphodiesterase class I)
MNKLERILSQNNIANSQHENMLTVAVNGKMTEIAELLSSQLSHVERDDTRTLFVAHDETISPRQIVNTRSLSELLAQVSSRWLVDMIANDDLRIHLQPIVHAHDTTSVYAYESLLRGVATDGSLISPKMMFDIADSAKMTYQLDRAARLAAIRTVVDQNITSNIFINFNPTSVYDPRTCLRTTFAAIENAHINPQQIVFEVTESEYISDVPHLLNIITQYRHEGFRVALDDLGAGYGSLGLLAELKPDIVKFDRQLISNIDQNDFQQEVLQSLLRMAQRLGIETVAEGIERPEERDWLIEHGANYLQGYLFGRPQERPLSPANVISGNTFTAETP